MNKMSCSVATGVTAALRAKTEQRSEKLRTKLRMAKEIATAACADHSLVGHHLKPFKFGSDDSLESRSKVCAGHGPLLGAKGSYKSVGANNGAITCTLRPRRYWRSPPGSSPRTTTPASSTKTVSTLQTAMGNTLIYDTVCIMPFKNALVMPWAGQQCVASREVGASEALTRFPGGGARRTMRYSATSEPKPDQLPPPPPTLATRTHQLSNCTFILI
ncbi:unnamed protein product [Chrysodeixis includens]|uniref:Uncharacterized protein n=1 Tax=Chrysodeixis includens TaxID=689277 RepID=A0A9N8KT70_CHRIL|nr:unnamed protein product [Chrysodeixis includens]